MSPEQKAGIFQAAASLTQAYCTAMGQGSAAQALKANIDPNFADPGETQVAIWVWEAFKIFQMGLQKALWDRTFEAPQGSGQPAPPVTPTPSPTPPATGVPTTTPAPASPVAPVVSAALANLASHLGI